MPNSDFSSMIHRAVAGNRDAWEQLLTECRPLIRLAIRCQMRKTMPSRFDESDIVQQTCLEACGSVGTFQGSSRGEFLKWLQVITQRCLWQQLQTHQAEKRDIRREFIDTQEAGTLSFVCRTRPASTQTPPSVVIAGETALQLARSIEKLPDDMRTVIELRFLEGLKLVEIAAQLDVTVGIVSGLLRRGLALLHTYLPAELKAESEANHEGPD